MNQYLAQHLSSTAKDYIEMREAEVEALRRALCRLQTETWEYRVRNKCLEAHLYRLAQLVLAGEGTSEEAQEIAQKAWALLFAEDNDENM
ncbi:MAG: hypothetical protein QXX12_00455 [Nanopusillaceae archaeon]